MPFNVEEKTPQIKPEEWLLQIGGRVERPLSLSLQQLKDEFEPKEVEAHITCLRGTAIGGVWSGVAVKDILEKAKLAESAGWVEVKAYSDYSEPVKLADIEREDVILAFMLDGKPIPPEQGGSLRLIVPQKYAYKSVKWVKELNILSEAPKGFWEKKGYPQT